MTDLDRVELRRLEQRYQDGCGDISVLVRGLRAEVDRVKRLAKTERDTYHSAVERAEATLERVRATVEAEKHYTEECGWDVPVIRVLAALAPVTEEGDKE